MRDRGPEVRSRASKAKLPGARGYPLPRKPFCAPRPLPGGAGRRRDSMPQVVARQCLASRGLALPDVGKREGGAQKGSMLPTALSVLPVARSAGRRCSTHQSCPVYQPTARPLNERKMISDNNLYRGLFHAPAGANSRGGACDRRSIAGSTLTAQCSSLVTPCPLPHDKHPQDV